jgi:DcuC family C4-dicarboxylate transporter
MALLLGVVVIVVAIVATIRRIDVRLVLTLAALVLGVIAGAAAASQAETDRLHAFLAGPMAIVRTFLGTLVAEKFVVPICCAMGFAHVLRLTGCDRHLIHLLTNPLRRVRPLLIPGAVAVGFLVNIPVISQTSTAVCLGAVLIPLLLAAGISPVTAGAALLLGSSIGGELMNPGAPEIGTISRSANEPETEVVARILPLNLLQFGLTTFLFWMLSLRFESQWKATPESESADSGEAMEEFRVNYVKALIPLAPVVVLFLAGPPLDVIPIPHDWLVARDEDPTRFSSRLVGAAMLAGAVLAVLSTPGCARNAAQAFFEGAGYAFSTIIAVIVAATCFGKGVELIGLAALFGNALENTPGALIPGVATASLSFAFLSGSGMASTQSLFPLFVDPATRLGVRLDDVGAVVALAAAAGRTISPVATVTLMCASMTRTDPFALVRRMAIPVLVAMVIVVIVAMGKG